MSAEIEPVQITVTAVRPIAGRAIFAFIDVELVIAGVALTLHGIQARHIVPHGTSIHLPTYRAEGNAPRVAVTLPPKLFERLGDLILDDLIARGVAKPRALIRDGAQAEQHDEGGDLQHDRGGHHPLNHTQLSADSIEPLERVTAHP